MMRLSNRDDRGRGGLWSDGAKLRAPQHKKGLGMRITNRMLGVLAVCCGLDGVTRGENDVVLRSLDPPVILPDGKEFKTWEQPLRFERTYYVEGSSPNASDANPGTSDRPFATINRAAQMLQPGERVVVAAGVYREWVRPERGGSGPDRMISYEAAPGATVVIKGSREFKPEWQPSTAAAGGVAIWQAKLDPALFGGYNPFAIDNVTPQQFAAMDWATPLKGKVPYTLPRGLVFQEGQPLRQVASAADLLANAGTYWVDRPNQTLHLRLAGDQKPEQAKFEITTQESVFAPVHAGLGYIRVKGFTIEHAAGPFPWEQVGAISTTRGHHWIIEDNVVRWANGVGMDLGTQHPSWPQPPVVGFHIVRRNVVTDCGICGICGLGPARGRDFGLLIEDNVLRRNAFYDVERLFETGAIKTHNNIRCLIRRNLIVDTLHGAGIWMDWNNQFSRCTQNTIIGTHTIHGAIFLEASYQPNLVDQNMLWKTDGHGIYEHDSTGQIFAHNLIAHSSKCGLHLHGKITDRRVDGREMVYGRHTVRNNVLIDNALASQFLGEPSDVADNVQEGATASLDEVVLTLSWNVPVAGTRCRPVAGITHDLLGRTRVGPEICAGPFAEPAGKDQKLANGAVRE
jgi:Right handed beta helix region